MSAAGGPPQCGRWHYEQITPELVQGERVERVIHEGRTAYQSVVVQDTALFGRSLVLDGKTQSTALDEFVYHESLVQPCMVTHPEPRSVFVAGGGEGATIREVLAHDSVERVVMVDIDRDVVDLCREHLGGHHQGLRRPAPGAASRGRPPVPTGHGRTLRPGDHRRAGPAGRRTRLPAVHDRVLRSAQDQANRFGDDGRAVGTHRTGPIRPVLLGRGEHDRDRLPGVVPVRGVRTFLRLDMGLCHRLAGPRPHRAAPPDVDARLSERTGRELRHYDGVTHRGMFSLPKYLRRGVAEETRVITEAEPLFVP